MHKQVAGSGAEQPGLKPGTLIWNTSAHVWLTNCVIIPIPKYKFFSEETNSGHSFEDGRFFSVKKYHKYFRTYSPYNNCQNNSIVGL